MRRRIAVSYLSVKANCYGSRLIGAFVRPNKKAERIEAGARLKVAREAAGYPSIAAAARKLGLHPQNLADHEAGRRGFDSYQADNYAKIYSASRQWLERGIGTIDELLVDSDYILTKLIPYIGVVKEGLWVKDFDPPRATGAVLFELSGPDNDQRYSMGVEYPSGSMAYPPNSIVIFSFCTIEDVSPNDSVIVKRTRGGLVETTIGVAMQDGAGKVRVHVQRALESNETGDPADNDVVVGRIEASIKPEGGRRVRPAILTKPLPGTDPDMHYDDI